jgi:hypothetical protein
VSGAAWVAVLAAVAAVLFLGLVLAGLVRTVDALRARVADLESDRVVHLPAGPRVGAPAPAFRGRTAGGDEVSDADLRGERSLVVLTDPECEACRELVPELLSPEARGLPRLVLVVSGGSSGAFAAAGSGADALVVLDPGGTIGESFGAPFTPHVVVADEDGFVVASGGATDLADVRRLVREAEGIRILPDPPRRGALDA